MQIPAAKPPERATVHRRRGYRHTPVRMPAFDPEPSLSHVLIPRHQTKPEALPRSDHAIGDSRARKGVTGVRRKGPVRRGVDGCDPMTRGPKLGALEARSQLSRCWAVVSCSPNILKVGTGQSHISVLNDYIQNKHPSDLDVVWSQTEPPPFLSFPVGERTVQPPSP
jgi:hypothetical protein